MESGRIINTATDKPEVFTDTYGECTFDNLNDYFECDDPGEVREIETMYKGPTIYAVQVGSNWNDDDEGYQDWEVKSFHNKADAERCADAFNTEQEAFQEAAQERHEKKYEAEERERHLSWLAKHPATPTTDFIYFG